MANGDSDSELLAPEGGEDAITITTTIRGTRTAHEILAPEGHPKVAGGEARNERNHRN